MSNNLVKSRRRSGGGGGPKKPRVQFHRGFLVDFVGHPIPPLRRQRRLQETVAAVLACLSELVRPSVEFPARSVARLTAPKMQPLASVGRSAHSTRGGPGNVTLRQLD